MNNKGFTLLEVVLTLAILAIVLSVVYGTLTSTLSVNEQIDNLFASAEVGPALIKIMSDDIKSLLNASALKHSVQGKDGVIGAWEADRLDFVSSKDSWDSDRKVHAPVTEVGYYLTESQSWPGLFTLIKRKQPFIDDKPFEGGYLFELYDKVRSLTFKYFDGENWIDTWDDTQKSIPEAIQVILTFHITSEETGGDSSGPASEQEQIYTTTIQLAK
ncbi:MAG: prepilin-type N-terminal cleavage/methylation domain-containing protein [Planctomycetes bacterium]|nr:prepilin-type N-terminal cleavage/methylation domain-containing protein [Planctomycetota bacterium]